MPSPLLLGGIAAGSSLLGSAINAGSTARQNRLNRQFSEHMYNRQRQDSLADWTMQNSYNHPSAVMQRLREAKLNPHLVYGDGANMPAAQIRPAQFSNPSTEAPQVDVGGAASKGIAAYMQTQMQEATINNLRAQNDLLLKEAQLKEAQVHNVNTDTASKEYDISKKNWDLDYSMDTRDTSIHKQEVEVRELENRIFMNLQKNQREWIMQATTIREAVARIGQIAVQNAKTKEEIAKIKQEVKNLQSDNRLKQLDINLKEEGIQPGDPAWQRVIIQQFKKFFSGKSIVDAAIEEATGY